MKRSIFPNRINILFILFFPGWIYAQEQTSIIELIQDSTYQDKFIRIADIPATSQETMSFITDLKSDIQNLSDVNLVIAQYDTLQKQMNHVFQEIDTSRELISITPVVLQNTMHTWNSIRDKMTVLRDKLSSDNSWISGRSLEIERMNEIWMNTETFAKDNEADAAVIDRIEFIRNEISSINKSIKIIFNDGVKYEVRLSESIEIIENEISKLREIEAAALKNIFIPDSPPLIIAIEKMIDEDEMPKEINDFKGLVKRKKDELVKYILAHKHFFQIILLLYVLLTGFLFYLKSKYIQWMDSVEPNNAIVAILNRPIATSTILILFILYYLSPSPIIILRYGLLLISIIPVLAIVLAITDRSIRKYLYILAIILVIERCYFIFIESFILARIISFVLAVFTASVLIVMFRYRMLSLQVGFSKSIANFFVGLAITLSAISIISNLTGNTSLSNITLYGLLDSILVSLVIYVLYIILAGLISTILKNPFIQKSYLIHNFTDKVEKTINKYLRLLMIIVWLRAILNAFNILDDVFAWIKNVFTATLNIGELELSLWNTLIFLFVLWLSFAISRLVTFILEEEVYKRTKTPIGVSATITSLLKFLFITIGFIFAITAAGFSLTNVTLLISAFGVGIGFGLQNIFNNLVSGIIIATERPLEVGDTVEVGELLGEVKKIGLRSSVVRTWDGAEVVVPNGNLISQQFINWTLSDRQRRLKIPVGVAYGTDPHKVMKILLQIANEENRLLEQPTPYVLFQGFGESSLDFELRCWTSDFDHWFLIQSDLIVKIHDALYENGIEIPFPQRDLHVRSVDDKILDKTVNKTTLAKKTPKKS
jgi:potassium efflux system protein